MQHLVGDGIGEIRRPVLPARLYPRVTGDLNGRHPVQYVVMILREAAVVMVEAVPRGTDGALGHVAKTAARHGSILAELPSQGVVCRQGACRAAIGISGSDGDGRPAETVVVLYGLQGVRPARVEHRHGFDIIPRRVLSLCGAWRQHEHRKGCQRHDGYMYFVLVHVYGCL